MPAIAATVLRIVGVLTAGYVAAVLVLVDDHPVLWALAFLLMIVTGAIVDRWWAIAVAARRAAAPPAGSQEPHRFR